MIARCPVPTKLQVWDPISEDWADVISELGNEAELRSVRRLADDSNELASIVRKVIIREPTDSNRVMKGIKLLKQSSEGYELFWLKKLEKISNDNSQVRLRVQYYDQFDFANRVIPIKPLDQSEFNLMIAPKECLKNLLQAPSNVGVKPVTTAIGEIGVAKSIWYDPVFNTVNNCPVHVNVKFKSTLYSEKYISLSDSELGAYHILLKQFVININVDGVKVIMEDPAKFDSWYDNGKYAKFYKFEMSAEFSNPLTERVTTTQ